VGACVVQLVQVARPSACFKSQFRYLFGATERKGNIKKAFRRVSLNRHLVKYECLI
jgi:hypothetical protein